MQSNTIKYALTASMTQHSLNENTEGCAPEQNREILIMRFVMY